MQLVWSKHEASPAHIAAVGTHSHETSVKPVLLSHFYRHGSFPRTWSEPQDLLLQASFRPETPAHIHNMYFMSIRCSPGSNQPALLFQDLPVANWPRKLLAHTCPSIRFWEAQSEPMLDIQLISLVSTLSSPHTFTCSSL